MNKYFILCVACLTGVLVLSCSQYSNSPLSVGFHNVNAKYNALFQAKIKFKEAETLIFDARQDNFSQLLPILLPIDSLSTQTVNEQLASVIKKASLVAERHQNSKWLDDAYVIIGQARLLKEDYKNAIETFKFVNTNATSDDARDAALIGLMRAYTEQGEYQTALRVAEILREEPLNKENTADFYLTKAYLHQQKEEYKTSVAILEEALPLLPKNEAKARLYFVAGQLYELINNPRLAADKYSSVSKNRPSYNLSFYAKLNKSLALGQTNSFQKLLKDPKNNDLQDKIYEAMATAEIRKGNTKSGLALLQSSARTNQNPQQLAFTYLRLADSYYNQMGDYEMASAYYDSTATLLPQQDAQYKRVIDRQRSLSDFVTQVKIIRTEDSLQRLSKMSADQLDKILEKVYIDQQFKEDSQKRAAEIANKGKQLQNKNTTSTFNDPNKPMWYFNNPIAISQGKTAFTARWGNRVLEDNWRRSSKENTLSFDNNALSNQNLNNNLNANLGELNAKSIGADGMKAGIAALRAKIPFSPEALLASKKRQEEATFALGKVYKLNLNEPKNAIITFEKFLKEFPSSSHETEVLYLLCLLTEDNAGVYAAYKNQLMTKYADSYFARLLIRSQNESLSTGKESEVQKLYAEAYNYFVQNNFTNALTIVETGLKDYPNSQIEDKLVFLKAVLFAKTQDTKAYKTALENFISDYPKSQLITLAKERLATLSTK
ncbi:tetratricopeptide repeat protein [Arcicella sp. DC2W]|uniref:Tetratricopeptide repeat protein n=1 Tax=Arcicella gelida TaxID=2984195 RepID=A0ABU5S1P4_9BACT|nr:tetratricopeptide repeat protein [Arcicella sp. DC2W]MEA5402389.1 tetratricopeptide repeat protein [Arcicella sp. DC2W]